MKNIINATTYTIITMMIILLGIYLWNSDPSFITIILLGCAILFTIHLNTQKILDEIKKHNNK